MIKTFRFEYSSKSFWLKILCLHPTLDIPKTPGHTFYSCPLVAGVWDKVRQMRKITKLPTRISGWWEALTGIYNPLGKQRHATLYKKSMPDFVPGAHIAPSIIDDILWEILRICLIWFIWCHKVSFDLRDREFHTGVAILRSRQTTIQASIGAWYEMTKYNSKAKSKK